MRRYSFGLIERHAKDADKVLVVAAAMLDDANKGYAYSWSQVLHSIRDGLEEDNCPLCGDSLHRPVSPEMSTRCPFRLCLPCQRKMDKWAQLRVIGLQKRTEHGHELGGVVYFVRRADGRIKIGTSIQFDKRVKDLTKEHGELEVIATVRGGYVLEGTLHHHFHLDRVEGEWFEASWALLKFLESVKSDGHEWVEEEFGLVPPYENEQARVA